MHIVIIYNLKPFFVLMQETVRSISFRDLSWDEVDSYSKNHGFKDRSPFIEYCTAKEVHHRKIGNLRFYEVGLFLLLILILVMTVLTAMRV